LHKILEAHKEYCAKVNQKDPFDKPGAATADAVRYLRYNHMFDPEND